MSDKKAFGMAGIYLAGQHPTLVFARDELARYLQRMTGQRPEATSRPAGACFILGTFEDLAEMLGTGRKNSRWDDAVFLKSMGGQLVVSGPNGRSILFSVYAYLETLGCRWLYPGPEGERVPAGIALRTQGFDLDEAADHRFRGFMVYPIFFEEGRAMADWMAKHRMNYYLQEGFPADHPGRQFSEGINKDEMRKGAAERDKVLVEVRKRGLLIERFGHGWLDGAVDLYAQEKQISFGDAEKELLARGVGQETKQLCLSHPDVQRLLVRHICEYLERHKDEQDVAAVWMGDKWDDACRCERCRTRPFSAWHLDITRDVARQLKHTAPNLMIEYESYFNSFAAPGERLLDGLGNVIMAFAPLGRCYRHSLFDPECRHEAWKPDFRNYCIHIPERCLKPRNADYMEAYRGWNDDVSDPRFIVDYFTWATHSPGRHFLAYLPDTVAGDVRAYAREKLEGCVSCRLCRTSFPTNLLDETFARLLWDTSGDIYAIREAYLADLFGPWAPAATRHMDAMREALLMQTPDKNLYIEESTEVVARIAHRLDEIVAQFDAAFPADAFTGPYAKDIIRLRADTLFQRAQFKMLAAHRNGRDAEMPIHADEAAGYIREHKTVIDAIFNADSLIQNVSRFPDGIKKAKFGW